MAGATLTRLRQRHPSAVRGKVVPTGGGGGGGGLDQWRKYGDDDGSYGRAMQGTQTLRGFNDKIVKDFMHDVGVDNLYNPSQLISSDIASRADTYAKTKCPQWIENVNKYAEAAKEAIEADTEYKKVLTNEVAIPHIRQVPIQNEMDHKVAREAMSAYGAMAINKFRTIEHYIGVKASIQQAARQTTGAF